MKRLGKSVGAALLAFAILSVMSIGISSEAQAQAAPLMVTNTTPCTIWVQGVAEDPMFPCAVACVTPWFAIPAGSPPFPVPPCGPMTFNWLTVNYGMCGPPAPPPPLCGPMGTAPSPFGMACGIPPVFIPDCTGLPTAPVWPGIFAVFI